MLHDLLSIYVLGWLFTLGFVLGEGNVNWKKDIPLLLFSVSIWPFGWLWEGFVWLISQWTKRQWPHA